ncbi:nickel-dependent hydrogenase large subunit [Thermosulfurimonas sp. F29]|uniref:nickel-dependent hydrogenase large subunit n=1 Tax=Thermosulfurimonas sp. F29 TaxID=2867247 RepID=UPI001C82E928|nr:nickel-dependent hydrogenase large subunit [Thermosulfurimonas sp. F29]MBX6423167.1 nickel-dependent hydrogenase large subunit [Thermosulfurimonas sp. F29]
MKKTLSPLTRIEGHLSVETEVRDGVVVSARCRGEMYRGFENLLVGRRPLDAQRITQRICGVCHEVHGVASARALAQLYGIEPPPNGRLLQDIILALHMATDHILHFYHLALPDYVDFAVVLSYRGRDPALKHLREWVRIRKPWLFVKKVPGDYLSEPSQALPFVAHYFEALEVVGRGAQALAVFGGKVPFTHAIFPGGVTVELTPEKAAKVSEIVDELYRFAVTTYLPDVERLAGIYREYFRIGRGYFNLISYGGFASLGEPLSRPGVLINFEERPFEVEKIVEHVAHSYYEGGLRSFREGETRPAYGKAGAYSWIKAPRYDGHPMETGPLSRVWFSQKGRALLLKRLKTLKQAREAIFSTMGRHLSRAVESVILLEFCQEALSALDFTQPTIVTVNPEAAVSGSGLGLSNAARGELLHYVEAERGRITRYQCVVPSTWNFSPRDAEGKPGPVEKALEGCPVRFGEGLIEVGRVVRSYDPCLACSIH